MGDQLRHQQTLHNVYKFLTNISNEKLTNQSENSELFPHSVGNGVNVGATDQLTIILNGETILPHPSISFSSSHRNMTSNMTGTGDGTVKNVPHNHPPSRAMPTDIYLVLVIATVSLIVIGVIIYALYKAVKMLKTSLNDAREDSLPSPSNQIRNSNHNVPRQRTEQNVSASNSSLPRSVSMGGITPTGTARRGANIAALPFFQGIRNLGPAQLFSATLRSTTSTKSDDRPPPYDDELPPPYNEAIKMTLHTREEECKAETTFVKMCVPSTSNSQPDVVQPSTSSNEDLQHTQSSVQIVIASPEDSSSAHNSESNEENDQDDISRNNSPTFSNGVIVQTSSDGDETDGRRKREHLKHVSMTVVI